MPRYKLTIEYDGAPFCGWQLQDNGASVQGALETAVKAICGEQVRVHLDHLLVADRGRLPATVAVMRHAVPPGATSRSGSWSSRSRRATISLATSASRRSWA